MTLACRAFARKLCALAAGAGLAAGAPAAEPALPGLVPEGAVVELPPLEVTASPVPWRYVALPGVEILSRCSDAATREFAQAYDRLEQVFAAFVPAEFQVKFAVPKTIVLADQKTTPMASQELIGGFNAGDENAPTIRFLPNLRLSDADAVAVFAILEENHFDSEHLSLARDHMRFVLESRAPPMPAWWLQGVLRLCFTMQFEREALLFPPADWVSDAEERNIRADSDYPRTLLPMRDVFDVRSLLGLEPRSDAVRRWFAQAALFVRWAMDGNDPRRRQAFWKFAARASEQPVTEALVREHFGLGYSDLRDRLSDYLPVALKSTFRLRPEKITKLSVPKLRSATDAEVGRIKGDWERLEIAFVKARYPQFAARYEEQARKTLKRAQESEPADPGLLAIVALNECDAGHADEARPLLEAAAQAKIVRPRVYAELARLRRADAFAHPAGRDGLLDVAQTNTVLEPLTRAYAQVPPLAQTYDLAAEVWGRSEARLAPAQLAVLKEGLRLFPANLGLLYHVALVMVNQGLDADAAVLVERGLLLTTVAAAKARFEKLKATLEARRAP